ncbi:ABC transporter permease [Paracoccus luteus]|uniref:ABC transporter permease n=1 Tax=Paracoccus luteus TaxID=2508543 RepID=UPI00106F5934|nr:ABC transporter permease [Paracoccus luteus]
MFAPQRRNRTLAQAALTTLALIYHQAVYNVRKTHRNAVMALLLSVLQAMVMIMGFYAMFWIMGVRRSPLRGDFMIYLMSGIFMFMTHVQTAGAVSMAGGATQAIMKHGPMNTAVTICGEALGVLYLKIFSVLVVLGFYHLAINPVEIENWRGALGMLILAWFTGACVGLIFLSLRTWWPEGGKIGTMIYQRVNMIASGKMFVANAMPGFLIEMFDWNPLFHIIDQTRGFMFINYSPHHSSVTYPIWAGLTLLMIGLMMEFVTRNAASLSWSAGR